MSASRKLINRVSSLPDWALPALAALLYFPLVFLGYGSDSDSQGIVWAGQNFAATLDYVPSRNPGYLVHEAAVYFLSSLGGSLASNLGTLAMALAALISFRRVCGHFGIPNAGLLAGILMVHPFFWANAAATMDYVWALGFFLLGYDLLLSGRFTGAGAAFALAIGSRLSTCILVGAVLLHLFFARPASRRGLFLTAALAGFFGAVCYLPALDFTEWRPQAWLSASVGDPDLWTPVLRLGRFFYKNLMFWGIPAVLWLAALAVLAWRERSGRAGLAIPGLTLLAAAVIAAVEILFLRYPIEMEYLLPLLPFVLMLLGAALPRRRRLLWVLLALVLIANVVWINPARPVTPGQAAEVVYGLWLEPGYLVQDILLRLSMAGAAP